MGSQPSARVANLQDGIQRGIEGGNARAFAALTTVHGARLRAAGAHCPMFWSIPVQIIIIEASFVTS